MKPAGKTSLGRIHNLVDAEGKQRCSNEFDDVTYAVTPKGLVLKCTLYTFFVCSFKTFVILISSCNESFF